jgi:hypothetical protein
MRRQDGEAGRSLSAGREIYYPQNAMVWQGTQYSQFAEVLIECDENPRFRV